MTPPKVYNGSEPYIFVSYSHKDNETVWRLIEELNKKGFRIWYDKGISAGTEFDEIISQKIQNCTVLISNNTDDFFASDYCKEELLYAKSLKKKIINVMSASKTPSWYAMRFASTSQQVFAAKYPDEESLADALAGEPLLEDCRCVVGAGSEDKKPEDKKPEDKKPEDKKPEDKKPEDKKPEDKKPETKKPAEKKSGTKKTEDGKTDGVGETSGKAKSPRIAFEGGIYEGDCFRGIPNGQGTLTVNGESVYSGGWKNGKRSGNGSMTYPDGGKYDGEWKDGKRSGNGVMTFASGDVYEGDWRDDNFHGMGKMIRSDGREYRGNWYQGTPDGRGNMRWKNGDEYVGTWKDGKRCGTGLMMYTDGSQYDGHWDKDLFHGQGVFIDANGNKLEGVFNRGECLAGGKVTVPGGKCFKGVYKGGKLNVSDEEIAKDSPETSTTQSKKFVFDTEIVYKDGTSRFIKVLKKYVGWDDVVEIPDETVVISTSCFDKNSNIFEVILPGSVRNIKPNAFSTCYGLKKVTFTKGIEIIGARTFYNLKDLEDVELPEGIREIGHYAFGNCKSLRSVVLPESIESLGSGVFMGCAPDLEVRYAGTMKQWDKISKKKEFDAVWKLGIKEIICSDGAVRFQF